MAHNAILKTFDDLYDAVSGDNEDIIDEAGLMTHIDELIDIGIVRTGVVNDVPIYLAPDGFKWESIHSIDDPIKRLILLQLVKNTKIFLAGHNGLVGSAILRRLTFNGYKNIITASRSELDLFNQKKRNKIPVVGFFGVLIPSKGIYELVEAMRILKQKKVKFLQTEIRKYGGDTNG